MAFPHLSRISWIIGTLYWPLLFLFVQQLTRTTFNKPWHNILLFIPFFFFFVMMLPYYLQNAEVKRLVLDDFEKASENDFGWINQTVSVLHILFHGLILLYYLRQEAKLKDEYAEIESVRIKWLKQFLVFIFAITIIAVAAFFARSFNLPVLSVVYNFHFLGVVVLFYWLSFNALTNPVLFGLHAEAEKPFGVEMQKHGITDEKYSKSAIDPERLKQMFTVIQETIGAEKLYLKNDLTLTALASRVNMPRHQVSQAINSQYDGNFFDLINDLRVQEFKRIAKDPSKKNLSLLGLAQEAGFNAKATFYAVFKKKTGMTPSEYLEREFE